METDFIATLAAEIVRRFGSDAVPQLYDNADFAAGLGNPSAAEMWFALAAAAERLTKRGGASG